VVSTHGEGDPPEDAAEFHEYLHADHAPQLKDLEFAIFALGDSSYEHFCQTGKNLDQRLEALGAERVLARVDADLDFTGPAGSWQEALLEELGEPAPGPRARAQLQVVSAKGTVAYSRERPFSAEVLGRNPLTVHPSTRQVQHLELSLEESGISYQPGDALGVWPENPARLVEEFLELTGMAGDHPVSRDGKERTVSDWLTRHLELTQLSRAFLEPYAEASGSGELQGILEDNKNLRAWLISRQVPDVVAAFPARLEPDAWIQLLPRLTPRMYSIASSPLETPDEVHLTVATVGGERDDRLRAGSASWYLNESVQAGGRVRVFCEANTRFRLPEDPETPVILIGPGTGVAPFRAFVQHRQAAGHSGGCWLFFGARNRRTDFLYQLEWQRHLKSGALARLSLAFSRDQADKCYVQHLIAEQGRELHAWIEQGAHVYVCGDAVGMAPAVDLALTGVLARHGGLDEEAAEARLKELRRAGRYLRDVY
jgi:sulfite reductase (NADPH) flavoprotein alpha-component